MEGGKKEKLSIREFYKGKKILVTGFTGTVGKLLVEKLLYSCPEIDTIYVLVRNKKGLSPQERIKQITSSRTFLRFKDDPSILESKLVGIAGDIAEENLGLSPQDENLLRNEINIIFHSAATVRFDEPLHFAHNINTAGTRRVLDFALNIQNLICVTHISTAYSNCDRFYIKEELYPPPADWRQFHHICDRIDPATLQILHMKCINKLPNTYTFTKSLAEHVVNDYRDKLPVFIVRPSIVTLSCKEPDPYYIDHPYTAPGFVLLAVLGLYHVVLMLEDSWFNQIPSDITVNSTIAATRKYATQKDRKETEVIDSGFGQAGVDNGIGLTGVGYEGVGLTGVGHEGVGLTGVGHEGVGLTGVGDTGVDTGVGHTGDDNVEVYNLCSPAEVNHPFSSWFRSVTTNKEFLKTYSGEDGLQHQSRVHCENVTIFKIIFFYKHMLSAYFIDFLISMKGITPLVVRLRLKILMAWMMLRYFTLNKFYFETTKMERLLDDLLPEEREAFGWNFDLMNNFMNEFRGIYVAAKRGILKPLADDMKTNSKRLNMLRIMDKCCVMLTYSTIALLLYLTRLPYLLYSSVISFFTLF